MSKIKIGILFGGKSVEHDVSIISAQNIYKNIDTEKFEVKLLGITKTGDWFLCKKISNKISEGIPLQILLQASKPIFKAANKKFRLHVVFPALHGTDGEDGSIQGLLKTLNIPNVGSDTLGSAVSMDKLTAKKVLANSGIPIARFLAYTRAEILSINFDQIVSKLGLPFIIKPANLGSSVGVFKISEPDGFTEKLKTLFGFDNVALIEEFIEGRELECAIIGNENPRASPPGEIILKGKYDFYSFKAKYIDKNAINLVIPAKIDTHTEERIKKLSIQSYKATSCKDLARIDLFVKLDGQIIVNEINTIPGFTNISMYPKLIGLLGIKYSNLITKLINMALKRHKKNKTISTTFESNL